MGIYRTNYELLSHYDDDEIESHKRLGDAIMQIDLHDGTRVIRYHDTNVVTIHPNGDVTLDSGGHQSVTTKKLFNRALGNARVWQTNFEWHVYTPGFKTDYFDGVTIRRSGDLHPKSLAQILSPEDFVEAVSLEEIIDLVVNDEMPTDLLHALPPEIQVAIDVELEKLEQ